MINSQPVTKGKEAIINEVCLPTLSTKTPAMGAPINPPMATKDYEIDNIK